MHQYTIEFAPCTEKQLAIIPKLMREKIFEKIAKLATNPRPHHVEPLHSTVDGFFRIRQGDYHIVYAINDKHLLILIVRVAHRQDVYKKKHAL